MHSIFLCLLLAIGGARAEPPEAPADEYDEGKSTQEETNLFLTYTAEDRKLLKAEREAMDARRIYRRALREYLDLKALYEDPEQRRMNRVRRRHVRKAVETLTESVRQYEVAVAELSEAIEAWKSSLPPPRKEEESNSLAAVLNGSPLFIKSHGLFGRA
ncbi:hypothetical protein IH979_00320 [Patescibacteria group bacterium]|nr:hypothetical protein [Patescibacteria group bacterium]